MLAFQGLCGYLPQAWYPEFAAQGKGSAFDRTARIALTAHASVRASSRIRDPFHRRLSVTVSPSLATV